MDKVDNVLDTLSLKKFEGLPVVKKLSKDTGKPTNLIVAAVLALFLLLCMIRGVGCLLTIGVAFLVPAIETLKLLEKGQAAAPEDTERLMGYWIVFGANQLLKPLLARVFCWLPLCQFWNFLFLMACYLPKINLGGILAVCLKNKLGRFEGCVDQCLGSLKEKANGVSEVLKKKKN